MNKQQKIIVSIVGITIVLLALLGITYAYYLTRIQGNTNTNSISITTADLKLVYGDGNGLLTATNIMPGKQVEFKTTNNTTTTEKTFTVTNSGNSLVEGYAVSLDYAYIENIMPSIFERPEDFQITLTCSTNRTGETCNGFTGNFNNESIMMTSNDIEVGETHSYSLSIYYNDPGVDQSNDMNKNLNLKVQIYNISESTDIEGTITGVDSTYAVRMESEPKMSTIVNGKYSFKGIEIGTHTLTVLDKDGAVVDKEYIVVKSGTTPSIAETKATVNNTEVDATGITITKEERVAKLSTKVESNVLSFDTSTSSTTVFNPYSSNKNSLAYQIINNAIVAKNNNSTTETIYSPIPLTVPGQEPNAETERTLSITEDDYGTSYVFRGNVKDNYVNFSGMCWKIIRIEGDGSIKLILEDQYTICNDNEDTDGTGLNDYSYSGKWNISSGNYGYVYENVWNSNNQPSASKYLIAYKYSENQSSMKQKLDEWLSQSGIDTKNLKKDNWCLGNTANAYDSSGTLLETSLNDLIFDGAKFYYDIAKRLAGIGESRNATLKCGKNDSVANEYIGAITADEVAFAGGHSITENFQYYLINSYQVEDWLWFWTLSPAYFEEDGTIAYTVSYAGTLDPSMVAGENYFRPAITLTSSTEYSGGSGMQDDPYIIE